MTRSCIGPALFVLLAAVACTCPGAAEAAEAYGAFAVVPGHGAAHHGYARGGTQSAAGQKALAACKDARCKVVQPYHAGQCAYVVLGTFQVFWNDTNLTKDGKAEVVAACNKSDEACRVIVSECL